MDDVPEAPDLIPVSRRAQVPDGKVIENVDKLSKDDVHKREDRARDNHAEERNAIEEPAFSVIVCKDTLERMLANARTTGIKASEHKRNG